MLHIAHLIEGQASIDKGLLVVGVLSQDPIHEIESLIRLSHGQSYDAVHEESIGVVWKALQNLRGLIETNDGATIQFDTLGFFRRPSQPDNHIWVNTSAVTFNTDDPRYAWLNEITGTWQGTFDMASYQHNYQIFIPSKK